MKGNKLARETCWFYWKDPKDDKGYFLAFVNGKGSCSVRPFDVKTGEAYQKPPNNPGDFRDVYADPLQTAKELYDTPKVSLEKECKQRLPDHALQKLRRQIPVSDR